MKAAKKLIEYLEGTGETDGAFCKRARITIHALRKYKAGKRIPRPKAMLKIKKATAEGVVESDWFN